MASKVANGTDTVESRDEAVEGVLLDTMTAAVKKLIARGKERGYVTYDELNAALPPDQVSSELIEDTMADAERDRHQRRRQRGERGRRGHAGRQARRQGRGRRRTRRSPAATSTRKASAAPTTRSACTCARWAAVELLSREGEIAIAKRIEAGRDMMIGGLCESPQTFKAIIAWHEAVKDGRMLLRDVIDLEATANRPTAPDVRARPTPNEEFEEGEEGEGLGLSLSALEEKLKPEALLAFEAIEGALLAAAEAAEQADGGLYRRRGPAGPLREDLREDPRRSWWRWCRRCTCTTTGSRNWSSSSRRLNRKLTALEGQVLRIAEAQQGEAGGVPAELARQRTGPGLVRAAGQADRQGVEDLRRPLARRRGSGARADGRPSPTTPACRSPSSAASTPRSAAASAT